MNPRSQRFYLRHQVWQLLSCPYIFIHPPPRPPQQRRARGSCFLTKQIGGFPAFPHAPTRNKALTSSILKDLLLKPLHRDHGGTRGRQRALSILHYSLRLKEYWKRREGFTMGFEGVKVLLNSSSFLFLSSWETHTTR